MLSQVVVNTTYTRPWLRTGSHALLPRAWVIARVSPYMYVHSTCTSYVLNAYLYVRIRASRRGN